MRKEKEKMLAGEPHFAGDAVLFMDRERAHEICERLNASISWNARRQTLVRELFGECGEWVGVQPPFFCDYGYNIKVGSGVFMNFNCVILDSAEVRIGDNVLLGPGVHIYAASHPLDHAERASGLIKAKAIEIGADVWIGGNTVICPGVKIGERSVIGAGSVVTHDIPPDVLAVGSPCRVIRRLCEEDKNAEAMMPLRPPGA